jgi:hypothetical protein
MQAYCPHCDQLRHVVGGRVERVQQGRLSVKGNAIVETVRTRPLLHGLCESCGTDLEKPLEVYGGRFMSVW